MVNDTFTRITGYTSQEVVGQNPRLPSQGRHEPSFYADIWHALRTKGHWYGELWNCRKDGSLCTPSCSPSAWWKTRTAPLHYLGLFNDITAQKEHLCRPGAHCPLDARYPVAQTGCCCRIGCVRRWCRANASGLPGWGGVSRSGRLQAINDQHGHAVGDQLLIYPGPAPEKVLREGDTLARMGRRYLWPCWPR